MRTHKHFLTLFILDYLPLFFVTFLIQVFFFGTLFFIKGIWFKEYLYFSFLTAFVLFIYVIIRLYYRGRVYEKLLLSSDHLNDYFVHDARGHYEKQFNVMIDRLIHFNGQQKIQYQKEKQLQKVLIYRFVHQMKTPVSVLKLMAENRIDEADFKMVDDNLNAIQYHLNQMLTIYKLEDFKSDFIAEKVNLNTICKECINNLKDYFISFQIYPKLEIDEDIHVYSDPKWLKLVIHQLLTNAIKYSHNGQSVKITHHHKEGNSVLCIIDEGIGIHEAELKKIFELFYVGMNGRNNADSSGIGLYMARTITEYLGHDITVHSQLDKGTTVYIVF
ncbi:sensor histidine kinase [Staphylococcus felis]|uniref:sensor histidine kinase n=1 Tax=Staphylococcus felis TaxID=46127 RepID=UPI000E26D4A5|nr:HAMP domain-containing sensor histidine kinase [Staphylococcus felis]REI16901.1 sensor histidine kinase [Staphylococcus felis]REI24760.1 sensor histidine kinase [Staphylococcus felis]